MINPQSFGWTVAARRPRRRLAGAAALVLAASSSRESCRAASPRPWIRRRRCRRSDDRSRPPRWLSPLPPWRRPPRRYRSRATTARIRTRRSSGGTGPATSRTTAAARTGSSSRFFACATCTSRTSPGPICAGSASLRGEDAPGPARHRRRRTDPARRLQRGLVRAGGKGRPGPPRPRSRGRALADADSRRRRRSSTARAASRARAPARTSTRTTSRSRACAASGTWTHGRPHPRPHGEPRGSITSGGPARCPEGAIGWDWFALQLSDGSELMLYRMRTATGGLAVLGRDLHSGLGRAAPDRLERRCSSSRSSWTSPRSKAVYPAVWSLAVASLGLDVTLTPLLADQELHTEQSTGVTYWEGACRVDGGRGRAPDRRPRVRRDDRLRRPGRAGVPEALDRHCAGPAAGSRLRLGRLGLDLHGQGERLGLFQVAVDVGEPDRAVSPFRRRRASPRASRPSRRRRGCRRRRRMAIATPTAAVAVPALSMLTTASGDRMALLAAGFAGGSEDDLMDLDLLDAQLNRLDR